LTGGNAAVDKIKSTWADELTAVGTALDNFHYKLDTTFRYDASKSAATQTPTNRVGPQ
jgi:hypothetical protein